MDDDRLLWWDEAHRCWVRPAADIERPPPPSLVLSAPDVSDDALDNALVQALLPRLLGTFTDQRT